MGQAVFYRSMRTTESESKKDHPIIVVLNKIWIVFFCLVVIAAFVGIMYFTGAREFSYWVRSFVWEETQCEIRLATFDRRETTSSGSSGISSSKKVTFSVVTKYHFRNDDGSYVGRRYDFSRFRKGYRSVKKEWDYLASQPYIPCYYSASNPELSVINRRFQKDFLWLLVPLFSIGLFAYMALTWLISEIVSWFKFDNLFTDD